MATRRSGPVATTDFPSGATVRKIWLTPSGVMAWGFPPATSWTKRREPRPGSLPEIRTRRPSGNHVAALDVDAALREHLRLSGAGRQEGELAAFVHPARTEPSARRARSRRSRLRRSGRRGSRRACAGRRAGGWMFCSSRRTVLPSEVMSIGKDQLSQVRLRSSLPPAEKPTISRRDELIAEQHAPVPADVRDEIPGSVPDRPGLAGKRRGPDAVGRRTNLVPARRPGEPRGS